MRMLLKASVPVEAGNAAIKDGSLPRKVEAILAKLKPEAAYFTVNERGERTFYLIFDLAEPSKMPEAAEPLFLSFNAGVEFYPVMKVEDLMKAGPDIEEAVKKYGA